MTTILIIIAVIVSVLFVKILGDIFTTTPSQGDDGRRRSLFDESTPMFDDSDSSGSTITGMSDDDSPARGLWDSTSIYYDHSDHHALDITSSFDDSSGINSSSSSFDD